MLANYATRTFILHFHVTYFYIFSTLLHILKIITYFYIFLHPMLNAYLNALDKKNTNIKYHSMVYILKSVHEWDIFSAFCMMANHSGIMIFRILSCLLAHHQRLTTIFISVLEKNPGYDSLQYILLAEKYATLQKTSPQVTSTR
ncbi:hypothetical protein C0J52_19016 [Blattella germanica]|nr:hypothetical protein C0J52_19016 [Blattella germanica]